MEFKVKRDYLLITVINMALLFLLFVPFVGLFTEYKETAIFFFILFGIVLTVLVLYNTSIIFSSLELRDNVLVFRSGAFKKVIFLDKLVSATRVNTLAGSFYLATDRIELIALEKEKRVYYYVSAVDNEKLFELVSAKLPKKQPAATAAKSENLEGKKDVKAKEVSGVKSTKKAATAKNPTAKKPADVAKKPTAKKPAAAAKKQTAKKPAASSAKKVVKKPAAKKESK